MVLGRYRLEPLVWVVLELLVVEGPVHPSDLPSLAIEELPWASKAAALCLDQHWMALEEGGPRSPAFLQAWRVAAQSLSS